MQQADGSGMRFLGDYLFSEPPAELLVVGDLPDILLARPVPGVEVHRLASLNDAEAWVANPHLADQHAYRTLVLPLDVGGLAGEVRLGRAIRSFPHRVLVHCSARQARLAPADESFFALGFRRLSLMEDADTGNSAIRWFEYRLSDYKMAPDWLNARFWANPERFESIDDPDGFGEDDEEE